MQLNCREYLLKKGQNAAYFLLTTAPRIKSGVATGIAFLFVLYLCALPLPVMAQAKFDSGSVLRQIERTLPVPTMPTIGPAEELPQVALLQGKGEWLFVRKLIVSGNTLIDTSTLQEALTPYEGRSLTLSDLQSAASAVALAYRKVGLMASCLIPKQEVTGGVVHLQVAEARFGGAVVDGKSTGRVKPEMLVSRFEAALPKGEPVNMFDLDRAMLIANDLAGASVSGGLDRGSNPGESRMVLLSDLRPLFASNAGVDNFGARPTGPIRMSADTALNSALGYGEQFTALGMYSSGSQYGRLGASLPVHPSGTKFSLSGSYMEYQVVTPSMRSQDIHGSTSTFNLEISQPLVRNRSFNLFAVTAYDGRMFDNKAGATTSSNYRSDAITAGLASNIYDNVFGGGKTVATVMASMDNLNLDGSPNKAGDAGSVNSQGQYSKLVASVSRLQTITQELSFLASLTTQLTNKNLGSYEKMMLGGSNSLRAYPAGEGTGDQGVIGSVELQYQWPYDVQTFAFFDYGQIQQNANNRFTGASGNNNLAFSGYGLGLSWRGLPQSQFKFVWAHRLADNPLPSATGRDQDGTKHINRFWVSSSISF